MTEIRRQRLLAAFALASSLLLAACGVGDAGAPPAVGQANAPDTTPPVIASIAKDIAVATMTSGSVTFSFNFSEDIGTSFTADDITVIGGTKGTFTRLSGLAATLVVTPVANSVGTIDVSVAAGTFSDLAGNANTAIASAQQAYNTVSTSASGSTGTCSAPCIDFASASVKYEPFEGLVSAAQANDPVDATNKVARFVKGPSGQPWAGATVYTVDANKSVTRIDLSGSKIVTLRVYASAAGQTVRLKIEDAANTAIYLEKDAVTTKVNEWETLSFDFGSPVNGVYSPANTYNKVSLFPLFSVTAPPAADTTVYFDELKYTTVSVATSGNTGTCSAPCIDFASASVKYEPFEGLVSAAQANDPVDATNKVARFVKGPSGQPWAGATVYTVDANKSVTRIDLSGSKIVTLRVYASAAGQTVRLKIEDAANTAIYLEKDAVTTKANEWETLSFDFGSPVNGVYSPANTYNKVSLFPLFSVTAPPAADTTVYFDELKYTTVSVATSGNTGTCSAPCIDFASASVKYEPFEGLVSAAQANDPVDATNKVARFVKGPSGQPWAGATVYTVDANKSVTRIDLSGSKIVTLRVYASAAGQTVRLKIEDAANTAIYLEKDAVTTKANEWETLSFDFGSPVNGVYSPANTYNKVSLFPLFSVAAPPAADTTVYFDELKYTALQGGGTANPIVFASGFKSNNRTVENGEWGFYSGNFTNYSNTYAGGGFTDQGVAAADSYIYLVVATSAPTTDGFMGIFTMAPGYTGPAPNAGVTLSGQTNLKIELGMGAEWFQQATNKQLLVRFVGAVEYANGQGGFCRILIEKPVIPTTSDLTTYTIPLSSMTLAQPCNGGGFTSGVNNLTEALARPIGEIHTQAVFPQVNSTVKVGAEYATGFTRGSVSFE